LTVKPAPAGGVETATICEGESYDFNGITYTQSNNMVTMTLPSSSGCDSIVTLNLIVNQAPVPVISSNGTELSTVAGFDTYQWYLDGMPISDATSETFTATQNGDYTVTVTNSNGCEGTSAIETVAGLGINDIAMQNVKIYPNPTKGIVTISASVPMNVKVTSMDGKIIYEAVSANNYSYKQTIDISNIAAGIYTVTISDENNTFIKTERIIVNR
jgi:hypothetical protein